MNVFFFNDTATTEIYTLSLHDALPIFLVVFVLLCGLLAGCGGGDQSGNGSQDGAAQGAKKQENGGAFKEGRLEEHKSEFQSRQYYVCHFLLEKKKRTLQCHTRLDCG